MFSYRCHTTATIMRYAEKEKHFLQIVFLIMVFYIQLCGIIIIVQVKNIVD